MSDDLKAQITKLRTEANAIGDEAFSVRKSDPEKAKELRAKRDEIMDKVYDLEDKASKPDREKAVSEVGKDRKPLQPAAAAEKPKESNLTQTQMEEMEKRRRRYGKGNPLIKKITEK